ncbi:hypothetical protein V496_09208 [Pseudogymnoascus sp. VKM F-4515 (FW-2607)]|nr:hypothetical protein V496_09208 [Pseudogymnoascus sp. VKM F-4515 (FW-2607)]KFY68185.1 hypothetical protein V498_10720 [Pseudogymnoascus sp. VKM F-4517 (FW-2822)]
MKVYVHGSCRNVDGQYPIAVSTAVFTHESGTHKAWTRIVPAEPTPTRQRADLLAIVLALEKAIEDDGRLYTKRGQQGLDSAGAGGGGDVDGWGEREVYVSPEGGEDRGEYVLRACSELVGGRVSGGVGMGMGEKRQAAVGAQDMVYAGTDGNKQPTRMFCRLSSTRNTKRASSLWRHAIACGAIVAARAARAALIHMINTQFCCDDCAVAGGWAEAATTLDAQNGVGCTLASACNTGAPNELSRGGDVAVFCWLDRSSSSKGRRG